MPWHRADGKPGRKPTFRRIGPRDSTAPGALMLPATAHRLRSRSEEHTSDLQSLMRISYAVFCSKKKNTTTIGYTTQHSSPSLSRSPADANTYHLHRTPNRSHLTKCTIPQTINK